MMRRECRKITFTFITNLISVLHLEPETAALFVKSLGLSKEELEDVCQGPEEEREITDSLRQVYSFLMEEESE